MTNEDPMFRLDACPKKMLGKPLTEEEREVIREVNRIQGWDRPERPSKGNYILDSRTTFG